MINTVLNYSIKWTDAFSLRKASFKGKEDFGPLSHQFRYLDESKPLAWNLSARHDQHSIKLFDKVDRCFFFEKGKL